MVQVRRRDCFELVERLEPACEDSKVADSELLGALGDKIQVKIVARRIVEIDRADCYFGLARDHLDRRAFEPVPGEDLGGRRQDSLAARESFSSMPLLDAHLKPNE